MKWIPNTRNHFVLSKDQWRCTINALDVLEAVLACKPIDPHGLNVLSDLKAEFPPGLIEETRKQFS